MEKLEVERNDQLTYIQILEEKVEELDRNNKSSSLEIRNIPITNTESKDSLRNIIATVGKSLKVSIQNSDIKDVYRLNSKTKKDKPIIVDFTTVLMKELILQASKKYNKTYRDNKLNTTNLHLPGPANTIYISENLTINTKRLFYLARDFAKTNQYAYCWTSKGKVYLRERDGGPFVRIDSSHMLDKLKVKK